MQPLQPGALYYHIVYPAPIGFKGSKLAAHHVSASGPVTTVVTVFPGFTKTVIPGIDSVYCTKMRGDGSVSSLPSAPSKPIPSSHIPIWQ